MRVVGFLVVLLAFLFAIGANGDSIDPFFDLPSFLIVIGLFLGGFLISAGSQTGDALGAAFSKSPTVEQLRIGLRAFRTARMTTLFAGFFTTLVGLLVIASNYDDPSLLGPAFATAVMGFLTAVFVAYFVLLPLQIGIEHHLSKMEGSEMAPAETTIDLLTVGGGLVFGGVFVVLLIVLFK